jgi:hypothetical protein
MFKTVFITFTILLINIWVTSQNDNIALGDTIAVIHTNDGSKHRGILISIDSNSISIEQGDYKIKTISNSDIRFVNYINSEEIRNKTLFNNRNPNYTSYCYFPSAFTNKKGEFSSQSHYFSSFNFKYGISDKWQIDIGGLYIIANYIGITYSTEIFDFLKFSISSKVGGMWFFIDAPNLNIYGANFTPRISIGNENRNISIGYIIGGFSDYSYLLNGTYIGAQRKIREKWTINGELSGFRLDYTNQLYIGSVTFDYLKHDNAVWSFGITGVSSNDKTFMIDNRAYYPLPYFGYSRFF